MQGEVRDSADVGHAAVSCGPMEFTLRYVGPIPSGNKGIHVIRTAFDEQLTDLWARDLRLRDVDPTQIRAFVKSTRFPYDVRQQEKGETIRKTADGIHGYHEVRGIRFVPLVTRWRYLRCELSVRLHRYEGDLHTGGVLYHGGDLDNKAKALIDALRMPMGARDLPASATHPRPIFYCVREDDRLITKITLESRNRLGPRPTTRRAMMNLDVDVDVRIFPVHSVGNINYTMLYP